MILVDTSVWVDHFRGSEPELAALLEEGSVLTHPFVIEELACGGLSNRSEILDLLRALPKAPVAGHDEVMEFVSAQRLFGTGIGAVDAHLLASARLAHARVWSKDKALARAVSRLQKTLG